VLRPSIHSKIHMAQVTGAHPDYMGSITIDRALLDAVGMRVNDMVLVANCRNGNRFETYIFEGAPGSGAIELNGAAAHLVEVGDPVIIIHSALMTEEEHRTHRPKVALMHPDNRIKEIISY
jgi:aspartate 1-decarboxylase